MQSEMHKHETFARYSALCGAKVKVSAKTICDCVAQGPLLSFSKIYFLVSTACNCAIESSYCMNLEQGLILALKALLVQLVLNRTEK